MNSVILGAHLDTNGGNARFVRAAKAHGEDERVLRAVALGNRGDPAGVVARYHLAAEKTQNLVIRSAHRVQDYTNFPYDILWTRHTDELVAQLVDEADVIHLNNSSRPLQFIRLKDRRKPTLLHHHGTLFRNNTGQMYADARARKMVQAVSTIDLQRYDPKELHWLPICYDIDALQAYGKANRRESDGRIRIAHAPTNYETKNTAAFLAIVKDLQAEGLPIDLDLIWRVSNAECIARKAKADILFEQLWLGYGCNGIEAWGLGLPVIAGADDWTLGQMRRTFGTDVPFAEADANSLKDVLRRMVQSKAMRKDYAARGLAHARKWHDEVPVLERLAELYMMAIRQTGRSRAEAQAVTFTSTKQGIMRVWGEDVVFANGRYTTTDVDIINRLRYFARTRKNYGIEEVA